MIVPTANKTYNRGRNWTENMLINVINTIPSKYKHIYLVNKDCYKFDYERVISLTDRDIDIIDDSYN
jgi:hypothetical protein